MNLERIRPTIDVERMQQSKVVIVGGAYGLGSDLAHCGVGGITLIDFDRIDDSNPARQDFAMADVGRYKVEAAAASLKRINEDIEVNYLLRDFCELTQDEVDEHLGQCDLLIFATDSFAAQARGNLEALRLRKPALWIGLYREGRAGEIIYTMPGVTRACYRCICSSRYQAFESQARGGVDPTRIPSTGGTILDLHLVDAIAGQIAVGLLTAGADNRMGRLIGQLGTRNLLQVKSDPMYKLGDKDIFAQYLGNHPTNFSFNTICLPMEPERSCPDCAARQREREQLPCEESFADTSRVTRTARRSRSASKG